MLIVRGITTSPQRISSSSSGLNSSRCFRSSVCVVAVVVAVVETGPSCDPEMLGARLLIDRSSSFSATYPVTFLRRRQRLAVRRALLRIKMGVSNYQRKRIGEAHALGKSGSVARLALPSFHAWMRNDCRRTRR